MTCVPTPPGKLLSPRPPLNFIPRPPGFSEGDNVADPILLFQTFLSRASGLSWFPTSLMVSFLFSLPPALLQTFSGIQWCLSCPHIFSRTCFQVAPLSVCSPDLCSQLSVSGPHCAIATPDLAQHLTTLQSLSSLACPGFIYGSTMLPGNWET